MMLLYGMTYMMRRSLPFEASTRFRAQRMLASVLPLPVGMFMR